MDILYIYDPAFFIPGTSVFGQCADLKISQCGRNKAYVLPEYSPLNTIDFGCRSVESSNHQQQSLLLSSNMAPLPVPTDGTLIAMEHFHQGEDIREHLI